MEKRSRILQVYALIVSIIAVITFLICLGGLVSSLIDKQDPLHAWGNNELYSSFENYKLEKMKDVSKEQAYIPTDEELRAMFETARSEKIQQAEHRIQRSILVNSLVMAIAVILFGIHLWLLKSKVLKS